MHKSILVFLILFFYTGNDCFSKIPEYEIGNKSEKLDNFEMGLFIDPDRNLTIEELALKSDFPLTNSRFTIKSIENDYWFVFKLKNSSSKNISRLIGFDEVYMETADIYYQENGSWHIEKNGLSEPMKSRRIKNRCPLFNVKLAAGETKTIYLKLNSGFALVLGIFVEKMSSFVLEEQLRVIGYWTYFGAALSLLLYNFFLLYHIRERVYLYYVLYAVCIIVFTTLYSGYALYVNSNVGFHYDLHASISIMGIFITLFTRELLKPKNVKTWIDKVLLFSVFVYVIISILIVVDIYFYQWLVIFGMPSTLFLLFTGVYCMVKKTPLARFYVLAMSGYLTGLFMIAAVNLGMIPFNTITRYGFLIGSFMELSVFSLALGYRVKLLQEEKITYKNKLLESEKSITEDLEIQVAKRTSELEEINDSKDKFFSIIAHDLRGPFSSVVQLLKMLKNEYSNIEEEEKETMIHTLYDSSQRTYDLLENLLIWSMTQIGKVSYKPEKIELKTIIDQNIFLLNELAKNKNIIVNVDIDQLSTVTADEQMLSTVIRNLISNAIKFTPTSGKISIVGKEEGKQGKISIKDTGVGISKENIQKLFSIAQNTSTPGTNKEQGTGIGLLLCKEFIEMHNGKIWVESELGKGSTFHLTINI